MHKILEIIENVKKKKLNFLDTIFTVFSLDPTENKFITWDNNKRKGDELEFFFVLNLWIT
jgi:hypothetical protein